MIRSSVLVSAALFFAGGGCGEASDGWLVDLEVAKVQAAKEGKSLLIDFTGSDWCFWCKKLDGEVFQEDLFRQEAVRDFVLVMIDYPNDKSGQSAEIQKQNLRLQEEYSIPGYPTVVLADALGRPYAKTGYKQGGAKAYLEHLGELQKVHQRFQKALERADEVTDVARARRLDAALSMLPADSLSSFYGGLMREIIDADPADEAGLGSKYRELLDSATRKVALEQIAASLAAREGASDWAGLIDDMDDVLREHGRIPLAAQQALMNKGRAMLELGDLEGGLAALIAAREQTAKGAEGSTVAVIDRMIEEVREELGG